MDIRELVQSNKFWAMNGNVAATEHSDPPLLSLALGKPYILELVNRTVFEHPIHLHGHSFLVITRNGEAIQDPPIRDTVLLIPNETQEIAFVADNPGLWMFHCHIFDHQETGLTAVVEVV